MLPVMILMESTRKDCSISGQVVSIDGKLFQAAAARAQAKCSHDLTSFYFCTASEEQRIQQQSPFHTNKLMSTVLSFLYSFLQAKLQLNLCNFLTSYADSFNLGQRMVI